ncbi:MAG: hypothetical protein E4G89_00565 [Methanothrix sp.]|nr:MAG: hypothetical protein E4G89_00565 [Methanothrix sp.]
MHPSIETKSSYNRSRMYRLIVLAGVPIGLFFGTWGYLIYGEGHTTFSTAVYHAVQLFAVHMPHLEGDINWQLNLGRWAAAISAGLMIFLLLSRAFRAEWLLFNLPLTKKHVVVCGLGQVGKKLALEFSKAGSKVVAIERDGSTLGVKEVQSHGITVIIGDANDKEILRKARVHHAMKVLAVCSDDDTNIAIIVAVQDIAAAEKSAPPNAECLLLLADPNLHEKVAPYLTSTGSAGQFRIKVGGFDMPDMVARLAFEEHPLDFDGICEDEKNTKVHPVVVGTGPLGEGLVVKALQLCHFANQSRPRVSIVGNDAQGFLNRLRQRHPHAKPWYDTTAIDCDRSDPELPEKVAALLASDELVTVAICPESGDDGDIESKNVLMTMAIEKALNSAGNPAKQTQILVYLRRKSGFGTLFGSMSKLNNGASIHAFGLIETLCNSETLLHEKQDCLARSFHLEYLKEQEEKKRKVEADDKQFVPRPAHKPWDILPEGIRESNRLAADHLAIKLRAIGYRIDIPEKSGAVESFSDTGNTLAMMEHERWCAERWLEGWRLGTRDDTGKVHNDLKSWDELTDGEKYIDQNFVAKTVDIVERAEMAIYPISPKNE